MGCETKQTLQNITLPHMPILGPPSSAANKDMMSKKWTNADTFI